MPVKTWVGRFAIVEGQPREESPLLRSFPRQRPDEEEDELYVLVEPSSPGNTEYCAQLVDAIGRMYQQDTLSMTGAALRALKVANQQLRDWNERSLREHRVGAGVSCLVVRGRTAYLAQVGPVVAFHVGDGSFRRIVPEEGLIEPLGVAEAIEPVFTRYELSPGDLLLLASPHIEDLLDEETLRAMLLRGADDALVELFGVARGQQEFSLVLLACVVEAEAKEEPAEADASALTQPEVSEPPAPAQPAAPFPDTAPPEERPPVAAPPPPSRTTTDLLEPKVRLKGSEAEIRYLRTTGLAGALKRVPPLAVVAGLILIAIGLLAWFLIPQALEDSRDDRFTAAIEDARGALNSALATEDPGLRRDALRAADEALQEAELQRPGEQVVRDLAAQVAAASAELDAVIELPELERLVDLSEQIPGAVSPKDIALGGGGAYFLDRQQGRVIAVALVAAEPEPFVLFEAGDLVGAEITGLPQHIAWAEELGALLILDDARRLISVTPPGEAGRLLTVRDAQAWGSADGIAYANSSLYVLDRAGDQVWRYPPSEGGFDSEREPLLSGVELDPVLELAVADALYLVMGDGAILRVQSSVLQPFSLAGIDSALSSPASLTPLSSFAMVLIVDHPQPNSRIVVFSPDGAFQQQLVSATFTDLRAIAVDERGGLLYMLVGGALYRTPLPPLR